MIHARKDYTLRIQDKANLIPPDEPVFLLRGQDIVAADTVRNWARLHRINGGSDLLFASAMRHADCMEQWAKEHGKLADMDPKLDGTKG